jgi:histidyl-tRNA synthetase
VGTDSLLCEAEIILMIREVFAKLKLTDYSIKLNNRKILTGISEAIGAAGMEGQLCVAIDKLDKIGWEKVKEELISRNFSPESMGKLYPLINLSKDFEGRIQFLKVFLSESTIGLQGIKELEELAGILIGMGENLNYVDFDVMLARGLSYYTGAIFEVKVNNASIGSVSGGGRYDNLTKVFGLNDVSGVGFSFGVDRLYDVLEELNLFPQESIQTSKLLLCHFDENGFSYGLSLLQQFRKAGIKAELYPDLAKLKKQLEFASKKGILFVAICGDDEMSEGLISIKNLETGTQESMTLDSAFVMLG